MKRSLLLTISLILSLTSSCTSNATNIQNNDQQLPPGSTLTTVPEILRSDYVDENISFQVSPGAIGKETVGEYFDLGVEEVFTASVGKEYFTIAKSIIKEGDDLQQLFSAAYKKGPAPEEFEILPTSRGPLSGIELLYQRPWGEPRYRFHDLWVELNGSVYVFSARVYNTSYDPDSMFFEDMLSEVTVLSPNSNLPNDNAATPTTETLFPKPPATARIAFAAVGWTVPRSREEIFVMNVDGSGITAISNSEGDDRDPAWSPDGSLIAFTSERDGNTEVYIMNADGSEQRRLTNSPENEHYPSWSPDGAKIVFSRTMSDNADDLFVVDLSTGVETHLTNTLKVTENYPDWSPNGKKILYSSFGGDQSGIFVMKADGSDARLLLAGPLHHASWSPDGEYIAFDGEPGGNKFEIYIMNADGSGMRQVTQHPGGSGEYNKDPSWSPDGQQLVYFSTDRSATPGTDIFIIHIDGSGETQLTFGHNDLHNGGFYPDWSPMP